MTWHLKSFTAEGPSYIPGQRTKVPQAVQHDQKNKVKVVYFLDDSHSRLAVIKTGSNVEASIESVGAICKLLLSSHFSYLH